MQPAFRIPALLLMLGMFAAPGPAVADDAIEKGFESIFDGKTLKGWDGNPKFWSVQDAAITGRTTKDNPTKGNTFLVWTGGTTGDFELRLQYKIVNGNSGIQYRSFRLKNAADKWRIGGYQADFEAGDRFSGILYGEAFRGILCNRGQKTELVREDGKFQAKVVGKVGDSAAIQKKIKKEDWNDYHVIAKGFHFVHKINGVKTAECTDKDEKMRRKSGLLALQLHAGPPMTVQFRNIRIRHLESTEKKTGLLRKLRGVRVQVNGKQIGVKVKGVRVRVDRKAAAQPGERRIEIRTNKVRIAVPLRSRAEKNTKKIVLIAGRRSHGYGAHEHKAGCLLLAKALNESGLPVKAVVVTDGWPKDTSVLQDADSIVIYADGGGGHPFNRHLGEIDKLMKKGVGLVCIHYGVEVPKGKSGDAFLDWTGGYFETHWSVNPHWTANYKKLPDHPTSRGVKPFRINDEWYYHMRFREKMAGVTPILSDLPPKSTLRRKDGAHSGNKFVREAVAKGEPQHTAWATQRKDGGRGFGFTGGHFHWNWGHNQFRKLVLNAIVWTAKADVPKNGVESKPLTVKDLMANQDYDPPGNFNPARMQKILDDWNKE
jgi:type 1 glutamine amidotransferase